eukprot:scaffold184598_cov17-Tisochrysis_lutea.AAC.1
METIDSKPSKVTPAVRKQVHARGAEAGLYTHVKAKGPLPAWKLQARGSAGRGAGADAGRGFGGD